MMRPQLSAYFLNASPLKGINLVPDDTSQHRPFPWKEFSAPGGVGRFEAAAPSDETKDIDCRAGMIHPTPNNGIQGIRDWLSCADRCVSKVKIFATFFDFLA